MSHLTSFFIPCSPGMDSSSKLSSTWVWTTLGRHRTTMQVNVASPTSTRLWAWRVLSPQHRVTWHTGLAARGGHSARSHAEWCQILLQMKTPSNCSPALLCLSHRGDCWHTCLTSPAKILLQPCGHLPPQRWADTVSAAVQQAVAGEIRVQHYSPAAVSWIISNLLILF